MPRNSAGVYTAPAGTVAVTRTAISSAAYDTFISDISQEITNSLSVYGVTPMQATLPMNGNKISGLADPVALQDGVTLNYLTNTFSYSSAAIKGFLGYTPYSAAGGTLTGNIIVSTPTGQAALNLNKPASGQYNIIYGSTNGVVRWEVLIGDATAETGSNVGSNFDIIAVSDTGVTLYTPFTIYRSTGQVLINNGLAVSNGLTVANGFSVTSGATALLVATATTPAPGDNSTNVATTAFVMNAVGGTAFGSLGSYIVAQCSGAPALGGTVAGSTLTAFPYGTNVGGSAVSGTWRYMGHSPAADLNAGNLFLRIT